MLWKRIKAISIVLSNKRKVKLVNKFVQYLNRTRQCCGSGFEGNSDPDPKLNQKWIRILVYGSGQFQTKIGPFLTAKQKTDPARSGSITLEMWGDTPINLLSGRLTIVQVLDPIFEWWIPVPCILYLYSGRNGYQIGRISGCIRTCSCYGLDPAIHAWCLYGSLKDRIRLNELSPLICIVHTETGSDPSE